MAAAASAAVGTDASTGRARRPVPPAAGTGAVQCEMRNVVLHVGDGVVLSMRALRGALVPTAKGRPAVFDDRNSYVLRIDGGEIAMSTASLTALMKNYTFAGEKPPIKKLEISTDEGQLKQKGVLDRKIDVPFTMKAEVDALPDGRIRLHAKSVKAVGLPVKPLMKLFGIELDDMMKVPAGRGVTVEDNDLILDPEQMLPPPRISGKVTAVRIEGDDVVQTFGAGPPAGRLIPYPEVRNYMYFKGNLLRFGKLTMTGADLALIDQDPSDPFDFDLDRYNDMLVAGYSKNTPAYGLKTYMPDFHDLRATRASARPSTRGKPRASR